MRYKAIDNWVLVGAEAPQNFWHFCVKGIVHSAQQLPYDV